MFTSSKQYEQLARREMIKSGFIHLRKLSDTLQGSIWSGIHEVSNNEVVIKVTNKYLHSKSIHFIDGNNTIKVHENILKEKSILKYLTNKATTPSSIVRYMGFYTSKMNYYLVMEHGGNGMFEFVVKAHELIQRGQILISEWHKMCKMIFKQMIECIEYIHSKNICHMDISLENWVINDCKICESDNRKYIEFMGDDVQIKLCDFGLSEIFNKTSDRDNQFLSNKYCGKPIYKSPEINEKKKLFDARFNDIWCLGICLFMMIIGGAPWKKGIKNEESFNLIMNGEYIQLFKTWNRLDYVNDDIIDLFHKIFQCEHKRIDLNGIKNHSWLR